MSQFFKDTNYADIEQDYALWDSYIEAVRKSFFFPLFQPGAQDAQWNNMTPEDRGGVMEGLLNTHEKIFGYTAFELSVGGGYSGSGLWTMVCKGKENELREVDGGINIPMIDNQESLQLLIYSMARNFLVTKFTGKDEAYAHLTGDLEQYNTTRAELDEELMRLGLFPMPSEFNIWLNRSSARYALQAASYVSGQLFGNQDIAPEVMELLHTDYMTEHRDLLAMVENTQDELHDDVKGLHLRMWKMRAQDYIDVIVANPDKNDPREALRVLAIARKSGVDLTEPEGLQDLLAQDVNLKAMSIKDREEAIDYVMKHNADTFKELSTESCLHVIDCLGKQTELSLAQRKLCDSAAQEILRAMPISESFLAYYHALIETMANELNDNDKLNEMGEVWMNSESPVARLAFLTILNEEISKHFGLEPVPIIPFSRPPVNEADEFGERIAAGFASQYADPAALQEEYGVFIPASLEHKAIIGVNIHPGIGLLNAKTPMAAGRVLIHEIGHHEVHKLRRSQLKPDDPRFEQVEQYKVLWGKSYIDRRLREDFSKTLYPLIQTEKFEYWLMSEFSKAAPFGFTDPVINDIRKSMKLYWEGQDLDV